MLAPFSIQQNSKQFLPIKEVVKQISYSRDYVTKLAREGKIKARLVNRQWLVDVESLRIFFVFSEIENTIRNNYLKDERRRELQARLAYDKTVHDLYFGFRRTGWLIQLQALLIMVCGIGSGILLISASKSISIEGVTSLSQLPQAAMLQLLNPRKDLSSHSVSGVWTDTYTAIESTERLSMNNGIVLFPGGNEQTDIVNLFSDNSIVEMTGTTTGLIYSSNYKDGVPVPFVRVPGNPSILISDGFNKELP